MPPLQRMSALLLITVSVATPVFSQCDEVWPDTRVTQELAKPGYANCAVDPMRLEYAQILKEQVRLLGILRSAYEEELASEPDQQRQIRLDEYNAKLRRLTTIATGLLAVQPLSATAEEDERSLSNADTWKLVKDGRTQSKSLASKIEFARKKLQTVARPSYCKLDFYFRLGEGLHGKLKECLE